MNCLEFRRQLAAEPECRDMAFLDHGESCTACHDAALRSADFESQLDAALAVSPPGGLAARILFKQRFAKRRRVSARYYTLAASLVLGVGIAAGIVLQQPRHALAEAALSHVDNMPHGEHAPALQPKQLPLALKAVGLELDGEIGDGIAVSLCPIKDRLALHLILRGETAPVNLMFIAGKNIKHRVGFENEKFAGFLAPARGGNVAVVTRPGEQFEPVVSRVRSKLRFRL